LPESETGQQIHQPIPTPAPARPGRLCAGCGGGRVGRHPSRRLDAASTGSDRRRVSTAAL